MKKKPASKKTPVLYGKEPLKRKQPRKRPAFRGTDTAVVREDPAEFRVAAWRAAQAALRTVDLFCGAGGLTEGFHLAGFSSLGGVDVDPDAVATFAKNFPQAAAICGDIRKPAIRERAVELARRADMVVGGPPCQAFSQVRNHVRLIEDPRNSLYREFVRVIAETLPRAFVMENVTGMEQMR